jgi:HD-GYP domain-containing protein (c-di-GMP phosphodiesterase class II)
VTRAQARQQSRRNLVGFLEGIGEVLGRDRDASDLLEELEGSGGLRDRVREMLSEPALEGAPPRTAAHDPHTVDFLEILADTIESRDLFMRGHARRVAFYAGLLADRLCLSAEVREHLRISSFLHDLGKVGVPSEVLSSRDPLGRPERDAVEGHTAIGERLIRPLGFGSAIASVIRHHHEHFDGTGYPDGVRGEEIPLVARIVSVADAFDAMTCDRPYRQAMSQEAAAVELRKFAGAQFDPNLVKEFVAIVETGICDIHPDLLDLRNLQESPSSESAAPSAPQQGGKR